MTLMVRNFPDAEHFNAERARAVEAAVITGADQSGCLDACMTLETSGEEFYSDGSFPRRPTSVVRSRRDGVDDRLRRRLGNA
ncbi:hypothetical protein R4172_18900 [Rhodococcus kroppenstedtii]|uniref:hypothetical protein n=1 Tax=Rhodococcoides kroppenstedtii TaxID=293050 RepID=UPI002952C605|nr:hypothetical protein [Rhodococcus kroppenstedtii]MDV7199615.1 hypothetical protein [Rhodococcus kroppenstedtii]